MSQELVRFSATIPEDLLEQFEQASGRELANDRMLLTH